MHRPLSAFARIPKRHIRGPSASAQCVAQSSTEGKMCTGLARLRVAPSCSVHYASPGPSAVHCGPLRHCHTDRAEPVHGRTDGRTGIKRPTNPPTDRDYICPGPTASAGERLSPPRLRGTKVCRYSWHSAGSIGGVAYSGVRRMNEVNARRARLAPGWVTVFGRVYHLGM